VSGFLKRLLDKVRDALEAAFQPGPTRTSHPGPAAISRAYPVTDRRVSAERNRVSMTVYCHDCHGEFGRRENLIYFLATGGSLQPGSEYELDVDDGKTQFLRPSYNPCLQPPPKCKLFEGEFDLENSYWSSTTRAIQEFHTPVWAEGSFSRGPRELQYKVQCHYCYVEKTFPVTIKGLERVHVYVEVPQYREVIGYRVYKVFCPVFGEALVFSNKRFSDTSIHKSTILVREGEVLLGWTYICARCAARLKELGRQDELSNFRVIP